MIMCSPKGDGAGVSKLRHQRNTADDGGGPREFPYIRLLGINLQLWHMWNLFTIAHSSKEVVPIWECAIRPLSTQIISRGDDWAQIHLVPRTTFES
jgi:hypothetical protein